MKKQGIELKSFHLHILAMLFMLCDHLYYTILPGHQWMEFIGRVAFPIFAYMIVEGFLYTKNLKHYVIRLLVCAVVSEAFFDCVVEGAFFYPFHQNVIWTFLLGILCLYLIQKIYQIKKWYYRYFLVGIVAIVAYLVGYLTMVDYYGIGLLTIIVFYVFHDRTWWNFLIQFVLLLFLNVEGLGGKYIDVSLFNKNYEIVIQGFAVFALIPIWLYKGEQGYHKKWFQYFCYAFYPVHLAVIAAICLWL